MIKKFKWLFKPSLIYFSDKLCHSYKKSLKTGEVYLPPGFTEVELVDGQGGSLARCFDYTDGGFGWCATCNETAQKGDHLKSNI